MFQSLDLFKGYLIYLCEKNENTYGEYTGKRTSIFCTSFIENSFKRIYYNFIQLYI